MEFQIPKIRIHRDGSWTSDGAPVRHERIFALFHNALERLPGGEYRIAFGGQTCPVEVEDLPFIVRRVRWELTEEGREVFHLTLNTGDEEPLDPATLREEPRLGLSCAVRGGRLEARFSREALAAIEPYMEHAGDKLYLCTSAERYPIQIGANRTDNNAINIPENASDYTDI